jgi:c-di-GMP-binding flagellar brake protein YcgR
MRVKLFRADDANGEAMVVRTFEMSEGGMSVYISQTLALGARMIVEVSLPGSKAFRIPAIVRNVRGFRCGLELPDIASEHRAAIARYLNTVTDVIEI